MQPTIQPAWPTPRIVYSRHYNIGFPGMQRLHPFDSRKYGRAWKVLLRRFGRQLSDRWIKPPRAAGYGELLAVHTQAYLRRLASAKFVAGVVEIPPLRFVPGWLVDWLILRPMRWATMGTLVAAQQALRHGLAINLAGGYHHAAPDHGHGFSAYADVGFAIASLRREGQLSETEKIVYVDLDAHQGDGVCRTFRDDSRVFIYDQYNREIFPMDVEAQRRIDCDVPMESGFADGQYLGALRNRLPGFLDSVMRGGNVRLGIYNAGTDIYVDDQLGRLRVSAAGVLERDQFVLQELVARRIPTVVLLSGGYSRASYRLVAAMVQYVIQTWGGALRRASST
ncbi:MAG TPA: histone deacetylase [Tepidisphaeraceae bacterium]|jgi:histone deacetylase 11|nr:histone deacetylase [Tepidisphaeraceae bacterium]